MQLLVSGKTIPPEVCSSRDIARMTMSDHGNTQEFHHLLMFVMEMLARSHYESMFGSTALVYRRSFMSRFECNARMCARRNYFRRILCLKSRQLNFSCGSLL